MNEHRNAGTDLLPDPRVAIGKEPLDELKKHVGVVLGRQAAEELEVACGASGVRSAESFSVQRVEPRHRGLLPGAYGSPCGHRT